MLFNIEKQRQQVNTDCLTCPYFDKEKKKCMGIGKVCFEFDPKTGTAFDPISKLPIRLNILKDYVKFLEQGGKR